MPKKSSLIKAVAKPARGLILAAREGVARTVNVGLTLLYWKIGNRIRRDILKENRAGYGEMCRIENWSTRTLQKKIGGMLYERKLHEAVRLARARLAERTEVKPSANRRNPG